RGAQSRPRHADSSRDQRAQHGEESPRLVRDRARVRPIGGDGSEAIEQGLTRHSHLVEPEPPIVDAIKPALVAAVLDPYIRTRPSAFVPNRPQYDMHPVSLAAGDQLRADC